MKTTLIVLMSLFLSTQSLAFEEYIVKTKMPLHRSQYSTLGLQPVRDNVFLVEKNKLQTLRGQVDIIAVNPNHIIKLDNLPDDLSLQQWGIYNDAASGVDANVTEAWKLTTGTKKIVVAITDTGLDIKHPDITDNLWENQMEINGTPGVDDDGNGFVDDFHGWNFSKNNNDVKDNKRHGTHVAGIVGARGNNGEGLVGVNWEVSLMPINFFHKNKDTTVADAIKAIDYAVANGAHVINASWGAAHDEAEPEEFSILSEAIERAEQKNIVFVAAAGNAGINNDNKGHIPASLSNPNIISVGAHTRFGWAPGFSNYGQNSVDVFAPGSVIKSTLPGGQYGNLNGTSMAAPFVSGIIALMLSIDPNLKTNQIVSKLLNSCKPNNNLASSCRCKGHIDAFMAVDGL